MQMIAENLPERLNLERLMTPDTGEGVSRETSWSLVVRGTTLQTATQRFSLQVAHTCPGEKENHSSAHAMLLPKVWLLHFSWTSPGGPTV